MRSRHHRSLVEPLAELHRELVSRLPDIAEFAQELHEFPGGVEHVFRITPRTQRASRTTVVYVDGDIQVNVELGKDTLIELFRAADDVDGDAIMTRLNSILSTVLFNGFSETVWVSGGDVVRSRAEIPVEGETLRTQARHLGRGSLRPARKTTQVFEPYG